VAFDIKLGFIMNCNNSSDSKKYKEMQKVENGKWVTRGEEKRHKRLNGIARASLFFETYLELFHGTSLRHPASS
jgi:hypothetical protein